MLSPGKSDLLNLVRWAAALVVVMGHADMYLGLFGAKAEPVNAFGYLGLHAHAAVIVFFVLSGYVVAYATDEKCSRGNYGFREYFLDRWSRIYSVLLMALGFTLALDLIGSWLSTAYLDPALIPQGDFLLRLMANLLSLQGIWGYRIQFGSNPALWSVGYEFTYYMLFGLLYFRRSLLGRRCLAPLVVVLVLALIGWKMATYFFVWLAGVAAYRISRFDWVIQRPASGWTIIVTLLAANQIIVYSNPYDIPEVPRDVMFSVVVSLLLVPNVQCPPLGSVWGSRFNSYMADFSYSIYAFHMPIIFFLCGVLLDYWLKAMLPTLGAGLLLVAIALVVARLLFHFSEARRMDFRRRADALMRLVWA